MYLTFKLTAVSFNFSLNDINFILFKLIFFCRLYYFKNKKKVNKNRFKVVR